MNRIYLCFLTVILATGFTQFSYAENRTNNVIRTSIIRLLAQPEQYAGKSVEVAGIYLFAMEESALYLTREDAKFRNAQQGLWIEFADLSDKQQMALSGKYINVIGI